MIEQDFSIFVDFILIVNSKACWYISFHNSPKATTETSWDAIEKGKEKREKRKEIGLIF